jgi:flagellar L-ring protein precursor FlgH
MPIMKLSAFVAFFLFTATASNAVAQFNTPSSSLFRQGGQAANYPPGSVPTLSNSSWTYVPVPEPEPIELHDIVTIRVQELARAASEGEVDRRKTALYNAVLLDWVKVLGFDLLKPQQQADGDQQIQGQLTQTYRAEGEIDTEEFLEFNIAAEVADIRPNGTVVLEAHRTINVNNESWEYSLSGVCRASDIGEGNILLSRDIADLRIDKRERGHVRDSYRRGFVTKFLDILAPF